MFVCVSLSISLSECYLILSYHIIYYLIVSYFFLSYLILSYLILSDLILPYLILSFLYLSLSGHQEKGPNLDYNEIGSSIHCLSLPPHLCLSGISYAHIVTKQLSVGNAH